MNSLMLALRNLLRNRRRSLATLMAMIIGAVCILLFAGYSRNIHYGLQTGFVRSGGHLQVQHKDYFLFGSGNPLDYGIADYQHVMRIIQSDPVLAPMITVVTPTLHVGGIAGNYSAGVSRTVIATGTVTENQNRMKQWNDYDFPGAITPAPLTNTSSDSVVVGRGLARVLQICAPLHVTNCPQPKWIAQNTSASMPADISALQAQTISTAETGHGDHTTSGAANDSGKSPRIEMLAATAHGAPNVAELNVIKAEEQGVKELDDMYLGMHLAQAQRLLYGHGAPQVTAIAIQLQHTSQIPQARRRLEELLAGPLHNEPLEVQDFETLNPYYGQTIGFFSAILGFISILIAAIVLFTVSNTMSMAVMERTVEIGALRAIGLRRGGIRNLFLCEGLLLGVFGAAMGVLIALALASLINHSGVTWTPPGRVEPVRLNIRVWGETKLILNIGIGLVAVALISAWWPARRAAKMNVVEALRHV